MEFSREREPAGKDREKHDSRGAAAEMAAQVSVAAPRRCRTWLDRHRGLTPTAKLRRRSAAVNRRTPRRDLKLRCGNI
jgi:hypothetical protein